jgi:hypothetical protein
MIRVSHELEAGRLRRARAAKVSMPAEIEAKKKAEAELLPCS